MKIIATHSASRKIIGVTQSTDLSATLIPTSQQVTAASTTTSTVQDASLTIHSANTVRQWNNIVASAPLGLGNITFASSNANLPIDANGIITPIADGTTLITVSVPLRRKKQFTISAITSTIAAQTTFNGFASGSLGAHLVSSVAAILSGKTAPTFAGSPPYANGICNIFQSDGVTRNANLWCSSLDLTAIPVHSGGGYTNGVLITKRDMIFAAHFGAGGTVTFVDSSNNQITRNIVATRTLTNPVDDGADILVATLDSDVPSSITPWKLLPFNFRLYLPQPQYGYPCLFTNQDRTILCGDMVSIPAGSTGDITITKPIDATRAQWYYPVRGGDSGATAFTVINGTAVHITDWHYAGASGPSDADNISAINAAIAANGSPYSVSTIDLTTANAGGPFSTY